MIYHFQVSQTLSSGGKSFVETEAGAPSGTLTQLRKPASSIESLSISPSTYSQMFNIYKYKVKLTCRQKLTENI